MYLVFVVSCFGRDIYDGPIVHPGEAYRMCVLLRVVKCNNNQLHLQWDL